MRLLKPLRYNCRHLFVHVQMQQEMQQEYTCVLIADVIARLPHQEMTESNYSR